MIKEDIVEVPPLLCKHSKSQEFLCLFKCYVDTGTEVLSAFADKKLLAPYDGSFALFLDDKKHEMFHLWQSKKLLCCVCSLEGCNLKTTGHMDDRIFKKYYDETGHENKKHIFKTNQKLVQVCLHKYSSRDIAINEIGICAISFLLQKFALLSQSETKALDTITKYRSIICHAYDKSCNAMSDFNTAWIDLENAIVYLADPDYRSLIQKQIKYLRKVGLENEEKTELVKNMQVIIAEIQKDLSPSISPISKCAVGLKKTVVKKSIVVPRQSKKASSVQLIQPVVIKKVLSSKTLAKDRRDEIMEQTGLLRYNQTSSKREKLSQVEMSHQINSTTFSVKYEQFTDLSKGDEELFVLWQLATPTNWNAIKFEQMLTKLVVKDQPVKIEFVKQRSPVHVVMMTTVSTKILQDSTSFRSAVKTFLTRIVEECCVDTHVPCHVDVSINILNRDELNTTKESTKKFTDDKFVQTDDTGNGPQMGLAIYWKESEKFDLAFLNGDDEKEIEWVDHLSRMMKEKYEIKCAFPGKEFLYGFPNKTRLCMHFKMFGAVVATVTNDNQREFTTFIDEEMQIVGAELYYVIKIPEELWKRPYINCTTCEHLWFPRLISILESILPGNLRKIKETVKAETNLDCEKCKSTAETAVYHKVVINGFTRIYCGSLIDEPWILDLIHYKMQNKSGDCRWIKQIRSPLYDSFIVFVIFSSNLLKCPSIGKYIEKFGVNRVMPIRITNEDIPSAFGIQRKGHDATKMDLAALARKV